jgi:hypothetical protein
MAQNDIESDQSWVPVVLAYESRAFAKACDQADTLAHDIVATRENLDRLEAAQARIATNILPESTAVEDWEQAPTPTTAATTAGSTETWERVRAAAITEMERRGLEAADFNIDELLDPKVVARIDRRFSVNLDLRVRLDRYDIATAVAAGLIAAAVDFYIVRIPVTLKYLDVFPQEGSPLTKILRQIKVPGNAWLERHFQTSFDEVGRVASEIPGFGGRTHRLQTFGHDPLLGLLIGTIDIMRGGLSGIGKDGSLHYVAGLRPPKVNPLEALAFELLHLLSDGFTPMGLPPPGWTVTPMLQFGSFGEKHRPVADLARYMYEKGYDSRHFLTMSTTVAASEVILRGYFCVRQRFDADYEAQVEQEAVAIGHDSISSHPRYMALATIAYGIACACNIGKIAIYQGNPLAINYAEWLRFVGSFLAWERTRMAKPSLALRRYMESHLDYLQTRLPIECFADEEFPVLNATVSA